MFFKQEAIFHILHLLSLPIYRHNSSKRLAARIPRPAYLCQLLTLSCLPFYLQTAIADIGCGNFFLKSKPLSYNAQVGAERVSVANLYFISAIVGPRQVASSYRRTPTSGHLRANRNNMHRAVCYVRNVFVVCDCCTRRKKDMHIDYKAIGVRPQHKNGTSAVGIFILLRHLHILIGTFFRYRVIYVRPRTYSSNSFLKMYTVRLLYVRYNYIIITILRLQLDLHKLETCNWAENMHKPCDWRKIGNRVFFLVL